LANFGSMLPKVSAKNTDTFREIFLCVGGCGGAMIGTMRTLPVGDNRFLRIATQRAEFFRRSQRLQSPLKSLPKMTRCLLLALSLLAEAWADSEPPDQDHLAHLSLEQLGSIEVTTVSKEPMKLSQTPAAIYVITQEDIRRSGATSIPEALRLAPGVEVARMDSVKWAIGIRGFESRLSRAVLVLIDGRSVYSPLFHGVYWEVQDTLLEDIDRIEVIRGPGGTIWGANAVNGVINIITKNSKETHGSIANIGSGNVDMGLSSFRYGDGNGKNFNYRVYGKGIYRGSAFHPDGNDFDDWWRTQIGFRSDWGISSRDALTIQGDLYDGRAGESTLITSVIPPTLFVEDKDAELFGGNVVAHWRRDLGDGSDFQLQTYYDRVNRYEAQQAELRDTFDVDFVHHLALPRGNDFLWGLEARVSDGRTPVVVPTYVFTPSQRTDQLYSAFVQDQIPLIRERLALIAGSKILHSAYVGFDAEPSGRLLWTPTAHQTIWAAVTRAVRTPSDVDESLEVTKLQSTAPLTFTETNGNGKFISEDMLGYEAGYRNLVTKKFSIDLAAFYNNYDHLSSTEPGTPFTEISPAPALVLPFIRGNGLLGNTSGVEVTPDWRPKPWWRLAASYSFLQMELGTRRSSLDTTTVNATDGASPRHQVLLQSFVNLPKNVEINLAGRYISVLPAQSVAGYGTGDAELGWHPKKHISFSVTGQNLAQPHHPEYGGDPGPLVGVRRSAYGTITWRNGEN
jgi:iron complex outermembrane recepter protein